MDKHYCSFCASSEDPNKLINLDVEAQKLTEIEQKLRTLNVKLPIYFIDHVLVPRMVCISCYDSLSQACEFVEQYNKAQLFLACIYNDNIESKPVLSDVENTSFHEDAALSDADDEDDQPLSSIGTSKNILTLTGVKEEKVSDADLTVIKTEPKDNNSNTEFSDERLNVQMLLDAAIGEVSIEPNAMIYAKEVKELPKKPTKRWADYFWLCQHCNTMFPNIDMLRNHSKAQHKRCFAFSCIDCDASFEYNSGKTFKKFLNHVVKHRKTLQYICPYCDSNYKNDPKHIESHIPEPKVSCDCCGEILRSEKSLKKHTKDYIYVKPRRNVVKRRGQPLTKEDLTCDICNKVYKNLNSLRDHKKRHHSGERKKDYTCENCGKTYFTKGSLTSHIMMSHKNFKPHECRICKQSFLFPNMLRRHVAMHSSEKPFSCERCGRCFRFKNQLESHQIVHTDSMPFICKYCGKAFRFKPILQTHERQHTGARPYSCKDCGLEFTNWSNFNKHMKRRHGTSTAKKRITPNGVFPIDPETGKLIGMNVEGCEEWREAIMAPAKRGRKKVKVEVDAGVS